MLLHAHLPVNESAAQADTPVEQPYIDQTPAELQVQAPGEDGEPQSIRPLIFDCCIGLIALAALYIWWPVLQAYQP